MPAATPAPSPRQIWMGLLARAKPARTAQLFARLFAEAPAHDVLRAPEIGAVMVRGRIGGDGQAFNLGEMTITRCTLCLAGGEVGHAHVQGRDKSHATRAALIDALMQTASAERLQHAVLAPLAAEDAARKHARASKAAATRVAFFTLQRGEDQ